jgi:hypothetical protein
MDGDPTHSARILRKCPSAARNICGVQGRLLRRAARFARLVREGQLTDAERTTAIKVLEQLRGSWDAIQPLERVRSVAEGLPDEYGGRGADALQLGAALVWCRERPRRQPFVCFDERLGKAASQAGFSVRASG